MNCVRARLHTRSRCRPSLSSLSQNALAGRPTTTAASKRGTRYYTSSTILYSGIFAVAATADAFFKAKRRVEWDRAIEGVKSDIADHDTPPTTNQLHKIEGECPADADTAPPPQSFAIYDLEASEAILSSKISPQDLLDRIPVNSGLPGSPSLPKQSIYSSRKHRRRALSAPWSERKTRLAELSTDLLIVRLMLYLDDEQWRFSNNYRAAVPKEFRPVLRWSRTQLDQLLVELQVRTDRVAYVCANQVSHVLPDNLPVIANYRHCTDRSERLAIATELKTNIQGLFRCYRNQSLTTDWLILKLCHALGSSSVSPNIDCYNALLNGMRRSRSLFPLVNMVVDAMQSMHIRINELSIVMIVDHYRASNYKSGFDHFLAKMLGYRGGLMKALHKEQITEVSERWSAKRPSLLANLVFLNPGCKPRSDKKVNKAAPHPDIFMAVTKAMLHFYSFNQTLELCQYMGREGWGLCTDGLSVLLADCAGRRDWVNGLGIWWQIKLLQRKARQDGRVEPIAHRAYSHMLRLCEACNQSAEYYQVMREAVDVGNDQDALLECIDRDRRDTRAMRFVLFNELHHKRTKPVASKQRTKDRRNGTWPAQTKSEGCCYGQDQDRQEVDVADQSSSGAAMQSVMRYL